MTMPLRSIGVTAALTLWVAGAGAQPTSTAAPRPTAEVLDDGNSSGIACARGADGIRGYSNVADFAGVHAEQMLSAILRHDLSYFISMREALARWMDSTRVSSIDTVRGRGDGRTGHAERLERAHYPRTLHSWTIPANADQR